MKKPIVAVDLDDVVVGSSEYVVVAYNSRYDANIDMTFMYSDTYVNDNSKSAWNAPDHETAIKRVHAILETDEFYENEPTQQAVAALNKLSKKYELYAVTGRHGTMEEATRRWLEKHLKTIFTDVRFTNFYSVGHKGHKVTKAQICDELNASVLIEDLPHHALDVASSGKQVLLFGDYPWNQLSELPPNMKRVRDWNDVLKELL